MSFCSNCGTKLQEGDVFCGGCGARFDSANANTAQGNQQTSAAPSINTEAVSKHSKQTMDIVLGMLTKPASTIKNLIQIADKNTTLVVGAVLTLIQGLFSLWTLNQFVSMLDKKLITLTKSMGSIMGVLGGGSGSLDASDVAEITKEFAQFKKLIKIPYGNAFFHGIILYLIVAGLLFLGVYLVGKLIVKVDVDPLKAAKLAVFSTIPVLGSELINILVGYINSSLGMFVLLIGIFVSLGVVLVGIKEIFEIQDDNLVFAIAVVFAIVIACSLLAIWKFVLSDITSIKNSVLKDVSKLLN